MRGYLMRWAVSVCVDGCNCPISSFFVSFLIYHAEASLASASSYLPSSQLCRQELHQVVHLKKTDHFLPDVLSALRREKSWSAGGSRILKLHPVGAVAKQGPPEISCSSNMFTIASRSTAAGLVLRFCSNEICQVLITACHMQGL